jgi:cation diffusion facilitator CzcD-associated flavoprotein CzcO
MESTPEFDAIVIGAGINGLYQLYKLKEAGFRVRTLEAGSGVGGAWYWNRYPGARLDSECYAYTYHFSPELIEEWDWTEEFAAQGQLERYFNFVADKFDLRSSIEFDARVSSSVWDESTKTYTVRTEAGKTFTTRYLIAASGILAAPLLPDYPGIDDFTGELHHTSRWPADGVDFKNKRVGVIGVGSTGIQVVQTIAPEVAHLTVFQRTPNWATPINNYTFTPERIRQVKDTADETYALTMSSGGCFLVDTDTRSTWDLSEEERETFFEELYNEPGLTFYSRGLNDLFTDKEANDEVCKFLAKKIAGRIDDPETARKLIPTHGFGTKRPPLETNYYEAYNRDNVDLVALPEEPIVRITATGIETASRSIDLDIIVFATGFDSITGSFVRIGAEGVDGISLAEYWDDGPRTYLGTLVHNFPNFFICGGPQGVNGNQPRCTEFQAGWIAETIQYLTSHDIDRIEATAEAEAEWVEYCNVMVQGTLLRDAQSWLWGSNVPGKKRAFTMYLAPQTEFRAKLTEVAQNGYEGTILGDQAALVS